MKKENEEGKGKKGKEKGIGTIGLPFASLSSRKFLSLKLHA